MPPHTIGWEPRSSIPRCGRASGRALYSMCYLQNAVRVNGKIAAGLRAHSMSCIRDRQSLIHGVSMSSKPPFRADHVGSFLRPKALIDARAQYRAGEIDAAALRAVEDDSIRGIVKFQEDLGLKGITDGEFRRTYFHTDFLLQLDGVV